MKKTIALMLLLAGITWELCAQGKLTNAEKTFDIPANSTDRRFYIDLGKGNKLQLDVKKLDDLDKFANMDSLIYGLLQDLKLLKDSLADESTTKRIDYIIDDTDKRKLRLQQFKPDGNSFVMSDGEVSSMKMELDTINFVGRVSYSNRFTKRNKTPGVRYFKASFYLNNIGDIAQYMNGILNKKITDLKVNADKGWDYEGGNSLYQLKADKSIKANANKGYIAGGDYLTLRGSVDIQNYKSYFVPSVSLGAYVLLGSKNFKRELGISWENHFSFAKNTDGKLQTFRSQFLTASFAHGFIKDNDVQKNGYDLFNMSFSYLISRKGEMYDKQTMRLGVGALSLFEGKTKIQPMIYFNNLFKGVTPGLRWVQSF
ncbi:hypothetical protein [Ferruginibacter sp. HRS2-29]|uniref:hypothetical protein n=1 Tax=Ferruginibacter sp. HRS2-29 TaxID=2487334 RepID=UPI0020CFB604|nr:hypothetical protein [Ferruginibacter sp. HRS2-29]MCP9750343.1 hypothetical protein [Ferruginibacter sp. HRS2-29]